MILNLTDLSDEPLQSQISRQIRAYILTGALAAEMSLPSIRALAKEQRVSVITVQRAYEQLLREGLIHSRRGKGFFVSEISKDMKRDIAKRRLHENLIRPLQSAKSEGLTGQDIHRIVDDVLRERL